MKRTAYILTTVILLSFFSCEKESSFDDIFLDYDSLPYIADSAFITSLDLNMFDDLSLQDLVKLYVKPIDSEIVAIDNVINMLIDMGEGEKIPKQKEINQNTYWQLEQYSLKALHSFDLESGLSVYTWYLWFSDGEQGPEIIMASVYKNDKVVNCFQLTKLYTYTFSRAWNSGSEEGRIFKNAQVIKKIINPTNKADTFNTQTDRMYTLKNGYLEELADSLTN